MTTTQLAYTPDPSMSYWPTPDELADDLVYMDLTPGYGRGEAGIGVPQVRILEPSAGEGHLLRAVRHYLPLAHAVAVEPHAGRANTLRQTGLADEVHESTVEDWLAGWSGAPFDLVYVNPPFTLPGRPQAWAEQLLTLWNHPGLIVEGGTLAAIVPSNVLIGKSRAVRQVRDLIEPVGFYTDGSLHGARGRIERCDRRAWREVGAGVSTALMWIHRAVAR